MVQLLLLLPLSVGVLQTHTIHVVMLIAIAVLAAAVRGVKREEIMKMGH